MLAGAPRVGWGSTRVSHRMSDAGVPREDQPERTTPLLGENITTHASKLTKLGSMRRRADTGVSEKDQCATNARVATGRRCSRVVIADAKVSSPEIASAQKPPFKRHCALCDAAVSCNNQTNG
mmetsp:Transcript_79762/g.227657  ORF Transcript_79762/g.227657 Transcript_79762/m.227657 type:complete len:123 (-) Transcript_79762:105-473(-)